MIAAIINGGNGENGENGVLKVYIGDELVGMAAPLSEASPLSNTPLYFLTIQSDAAGTLRFTTADGQELLVAPSSLHEGDGGRLIYAPDAHYGSLSKPVILTPAEKGTGDVYKVIENDRVIIIRNNERYDVMGIKF